MYQKNDKQHVQENDINPDCPSASSPWVLKTKPARDRLVFERQPPTYYRGSSTGAPGPQGPALYRTGIFF